MGVADLIKFTDLTQDVRCSQTVCWAHEYNNQDSRDAEDVASCVGAKSDFTFVLVDAGDVAGAYLK